MVISFLDMLIPYS